MVAVIGSSIVGYLILARGFPGQWRNAFVRIADTSWYITFIGLVIVMSVTAGIKFVLRRESLLAGGMPSIHSAISFSIWTLVSLLTFNREPLISLLVFLLAFLVAQSRVLRKVHRIEEVVIGSVLGVALTMLIIQLFWRFR